MIAPENTGRTTPLQHVQAQTLKITPITNGQTTTNTSHQKTKSHQKHTTKNKSPHQSPSLKTPIKFSPRSPFLTCVNSDEFSN